MRCIISRNIEEEIALVVHVEDVVDIMVHVVEVSVEVLTKVITELHHLDRDMTITEVMM